ncbi:MAG: signal peptidase I [Chloroflexi bacterium]|nr:signal peptidase I [Chloroflexota bacterium]
MRAAIREIIETIILSLLLFIGIQFTVQTYQVEGASMYPTLSQGQYLLVNKVIYRHLNVGETVDIAAHKDDESPGSHIFPFHPPQRGEVVVFNAPEDPTRDFVKRVMGVPGDMVEIRNGRTYINGTRLQEDYAELDDFDEMEEFIVPANSYFVMGDNRRHSNDSRDWGTVPLEHIVGRAWVRYWPPHEIHVFPTEQVFSASASAVKGYQ